MNMYFNLILHTIINRMYNIVIYFPYIQEFNIFIPQSFLLFYLQLCLFEMWQGTRCERNSAQI